VRGLAGTKRQKDRNGGGSSRRAEELSMGELQRARYSVLRNDSIKLNDLERRTTVSLLRRSCKRCMTSNSNAPSRQAQFLNSTSHSMTGWMLL
jgi:hypothetical protein